MGKNTSSNVPSWERITAYTLRILILLSGVYQTFFGEQAIGILTLICIVAIMMPGIFTKNFIRRFPVEIEILLFIMVFFQFILGEARDFYVTVPYYDKIVHYLLPMFLGIIGFLVFYTMYAFGNIKTSITAMMYIIIFITMGIGAGWEIFEYFSDTFLASRIDGWHHFQGNAQQDPHTDTMTDLINDTLGGVFGSLLGLWVMKKSHKENGRFTSLIHEMDETLYRNSKNDTV